MYWILLLILIPSIAGHAIHSTDNCRQEFKKTLNCSKVFDEFELLKSNHSVTDVQEMKKEYIECVGNVECSLIQKKVSFTLTSWNFNEKITAIKSCLEEGRLFATEDKCGDTNRDCYFTDFIKCSATVLKNSGHCSPVEIDAYIAMEPLFQEYCEQRNALRAFEESFIPS